MPFPSLCLEEVDSLNVAENCNCTSSYENDGESHHVAILEMCVWAGGGGQQRNKLALCNPAIHVVSHSSPPNPSSHITVVYYCGTTKCQGKYSTTFRQKYK